MRSRQIGYTSFSLLLGLATLAQAQVSPEQRFTEPEDVTLQAKPFVLVTHPGTEWDKKAVAKPGMDAVMKIAQESGWQGVYLQYELDRSQYYPENQDPDYLVHSYGGEFTFEIPGDTVISMGGWFSNCHSLTIRTLLKRFSKQKKGDRHIVVVTEGVFEGVFSPFSQSLLSSEEQREFEQGFGNFTVPISAVLRSRPEEKAFSALVRFAENNYVLPSQELQLNITLRYMGQERAWRKTAAFPTVTIEFVHVDIDEPKIDLDKPKTDAVVE